MTQTKLLRRRFAWLLSFILVCSMVGMPFTQAFAAEVIPDEETMIVVPEGSEEIVLEPGAETLVPITSTEDPDEPDQGIDEPQEGSEPEEEDEPADIEEPVVTR